MITKENGLRYAKLIHVSVDNGKTDNSNKVYIMEEQSDGRIKCEYGRVGKSLVTEYKPSSKWSAVYNQKTGKSKGYTDVTELLAEPVISVKANKKTEAIKDAIVRKLIDDLMAYANKVIQTNYKVTQDAVSQQQVDTAQDIINSISAILKIGVEAKSINDLLLKLYTTIPRKMDNVKNHLISDVKNDNSLKSALNLIEHEQDTLDTMAGQVQLIKQKTQIDNSDKTKAEQNITILEQMGISVEIEKDTTTIDLIHKLMGPNKHQAKKIFKIINHKTQKLFDKHLKDAEIKKKRLYWHGSRNANFFNILQTGLLIRPSGAIHNGSMFGDGIYFADKAQKSIGYSSLSGSYWTKESDNKGYLALFEVHVGNQMEITKWKHEHKSLSEKILKKDGYDSVFAKGGYDLRNNEYIVYKSAQCTITHLIEIGH